MQDAAERLITDLPILNAIDHRETGSDPYNGQQSVLNLSIVKALLFKLINQGSHYGPRKGISVGIHSALPFISAMPTSA